MPHQSQRPVLGKQGTSSKPQKAQALKNTRSWAPPKSFQETMSELDNMPTQKSKRRRKAPVHDEVEAAPHTVLDLD